MSWETGLRRLAQGILVLALVVGVCRLLDEAIGDGPISGMRPLHPEYRPLLERNRTSGVSKVRYLLPEFYWRALVPTRQLLEAVNPDVAAWLAELHSQRRIVYDFRLPLDHPSYQGTLAFQSPLVPFLLLSPAFWDESDFDKAAILVHEYRHSRQNFPKVMAERGWQLLTLKVLTDPDDTRLEQEAYTYQAAFYRACGRNPSWLQEYLRQRDPGRSDL